MLRITVEVWPHGSSEERREIAAVAVGRVGQGFAERARYAVLTSGDGLAEPSRAGVVEHLPQDGCLSLLQQALEQATVDGHSELQEDQLEVLRDALRSDAERSAAAWQQLDDQINTHPETAGLDQAMRERLRDEMAGILLMGSPKLARRWEAAHDRILADAWSYDQAAEVTGLPETDLRSAVQRGDLVALEAPRGVVKLPPWQFAGTRPSPVAGIAQVVASVTGSVIELDAWMQRPNPALRRRTPAQALADGDNAEVVAAAIAGV